MSAIELELPYPPTVNTYWRHMKNGRTYVSPEGKQYQAQVFWLTRQLPKFAGTVELAVEVYFPDNRARDLDNLGKCLLDSLVKAQLFRDDCWQVLRKVVWEAKGIRKGGAVVVKIQEVENDKTGA